MQGHFGYGKVKSRNKVSFYISKTSSVMNNPLCFRVKNWFYTNIYVFTNPSIQAGCDTRSIFLSSV